MVDDRNIGTVLKEGPDDGSRSTDGFPLTMFETITPVVFDSAGREIPATIAESYVTAGCGCGNLNYKKREDDKRTEDGKRTEDFDC